MKRFRTGPTDIPKEAGQAPDRPSGALDRFFASSPDLLAILDREGRFLRASASWTATLGWRPAELAGRAFADLVHPSDRERTRNEFERLAAGRSLQSLEHRCLARTGMCCWLQWSAVRDPDGTLFLLGRDVSGQRAAIALLEGTRSRAEQLLVEAISAMTDGFALYDPDDRLVLCNDRFRSLYRSLDEAGQLVGRTFTEILEHAVGLVDIDEPLARSDPAAWIAARVALHRNPPAQPFEQRMSDGRWLLVSERRTSHGGTVTILTEITAQKRAEQRLLDALCSIREGFVLWDAEDRLVLCNQTFRDMYRPVAPLLVAGTPYERILRTGIEYGLFRISEPAEEWIRRRLASHRTPGEASEQELSDGRWFLVTERRTAEGGIVGVSTDITALKEQERQLRRNEAKLTRSIAELQATQQRLGQQARDLADLATKHAIEKRRAEEASLSKSRFLAHMSHELRTPLNAVIGFSDVMRSECFGPLGSPKYAEYAQLIFESGRHLLDLINDVLDMSKVEAGRYGIAPAPLDPARAVGEAVQLMNRWAEEGGVALAVTVPADPVQVLADRRALRQVLLNLLSNAFKFTPEGGRVQVSVESADGMVRFVVRDTGIGIPAEDLPRLGQPFEQVDGHRSGKQRGTGLGLALSKGLVELHGGQFVIESEEGAGTTVTFTLPAVSPGRGGQGHPPAAG